jgi:hypothetical protein
MGDVFLGSNTKANFHASQQVQGTVFTHQDAKLGQARTDALNASATFAALAPTTSVPGNAVNGTTTVNGGPGVNVLNVTGVKLGNGQTLTLNGPAGSQFVINDSGDLTLNSGKVELTGGLTPADVVFNFTDTSPAIKTSGGMKHESVVNGILLASGVGTTVDFSPGLVFGEVIVGGEHAHFQ